jgi:hypothetical protein
MQTDSYVSPMKPGHKIQVPQMAKWFRTWRCLWIDCLRANSRSCRYRSLVLSLPPRDGGTLPLQFPSHIQSGI